ncbi:hypothetical protein CEXT_667491 [Caerostris extrusa]|uniref:Uncharacterized protein n=1 Tax=Caerostris extrusa TaxID=172846 RepID=A0AAV4TIG1_CAEEX|nr:hypothetical protein CEXT_667491 [Caerostris extrusa]
MDYFTVWEWPLSMYGMASIYVQGMASISVWEWPLSLCGNGLYVCAGMSSFSVKEWRLSLCSNCIYWDLRYNLRPFTLRTTNIKADLGVTCSAPILHSQCAITIFEI